MYPPVDPVLFTLGPVTLHWYGISMTLAIFLGTWVASRYVTRKGGDGGAIWDMLLWVLIPGIIGARLYYVFIQSSAEKRAQFLANPIEILQIWNGGIHIYGALIVGGIALFLYMRLNKLPLFTYLDGIGLGLALGQTIGRLGNFINQELYGWPTTLPWGLRIDPEHRIPPYNDMEAYPETTRFHPLFLYEMIWDALGFILLSLISRRLGNRLLKGDLFLLYLIWIPFGRFWIEFMRTDSWFFPGMPFNTLHIIIALLVIGATTTLIWRHRNRPAIPDISSTSDEEDEDKDNEEKVATAVSKTAKTSAEQEKAETTSDTPDEQDEEPKSTSKTKPVSSSEEHT